MRPYRLLTPEEARVRFERLKKTLGIEVEKPEKPRPEMQAEFPQWQTRGNEAKSSRQGS